MLFYNQYCVHSMIIFFIDKFLRNKVFLNIIDILSKYATKVDRVKVVIGETI